MQQTQLKPNVPVVSFIGNSNSGKTTLVVEIVSRLKQLGYRVATVKHAAHGFDIDRPGKDSYRFRKAGSDVTVISSSTQLALVKDTFVEVSLSEIIDLIGETVDIILVEGYKNSEIPKIAVMANESDTGMLIEKQNILVILFVSATMKGIPQFAQGDIDYIVDLLINLITGCPVYKHNMDNYVGNSDRATNHDRDAIEEIASGLHSMIFLPITPSS